MGDARRNLGTVVDLGHDGSLVVKSPPRSKEGSPRPPLGNPVVDPQNRNVGKVREVVGPVRSPWFLVEPNRPGDAHRLLGKEVFAGSRGRGKRGGTR